MPSWDVHRFWYRKLGINVAIVSKVDRLIDVEKKYRGLVIGHDQIKSSDVDFVTAVVLFYDDFGDDGVKAMMLHGILDYMHSLVNKGYHNGEIMWRVLAWLKFMGAKNVIRRISRLLPEGERLTYVRRLGYDYCGICFYEIYFSEHVVSDIAKRFGCNKKIINPYIIMKIVKEVENFVEKHFNEIVNDIKKNEKNVLL